MEKSVDGVHGIRTLGRRMVSAVETTEQWRTPNIVFFVTSANSQSIESLVQCLKDKILNSSHPCHQCSWTLTKANSIKDVIILPRRPSKEDKLFRCSERHS